MSDIKKLLARIGTARDAISRKEEQTSLDYMIDGVLMNCSVMLKEQEAVKPRKKDDGNPQPWTSWWYVCGDCGQEIEYHDRYCRWCGRAVQWDG